MPSLRTHLAHAGLRALVRRPLLNDALRVGVIHALRARIAARAARAPAPKGVEIEHIELAGLRAERCSPIAARLPNRVVLYLHGGAFMVGSARMYRALTAALSRATSAVVVTPDYRLAPEDVFPAAPDDALACYRALLEAGHRSDDIVIAGDSAGGNLVLGLLQRLHSEGLPQPAAAVALSPWADLTHSGDSIVTHAARDPVLPAHRMPEAARTYAPEADLRDPLVSPLFGDFRGLAPLLLHVGSEEVLLDDARRVDDAVRCAGGDCRLRVWSGQAHVFQVFTSLLPESRDAIEDIAGFVLSHWIGAADRRAADPRPAPDMPARIALA